MRFFPGSLALVIALSVIAACESNQPKPIELSGPAATINRLIDERGPLTYLSRSYSAPGVPDGSSEVTGMLVMRHPADLRPIGGDYYDDGFGNLVRFGEFVAPELGGRSRYAVTFRRNGGAQLAFDFRDDDVADAVFDLGPDGRLGAIADPDIQWFLDCMSQEMAGGANLAVAANVCLAKAGDSGGGGGLGADVENDFNRLAKPDCAKRGGGLPGSVTGEGQQGQTTTTVVESSDGSRIKISTTEYPDGSSDVRIEVRDNKGRLVYLENTRIDAAYQQASRQVERSTYSEGLNTISIRRWEYGNPVRAPQNTQSQIEAERLRPKIRRPPPGPDCTDCPVEDPRCREAPNDIVSLWDCQAQTDMSLLECLKRMQDAIYTATGGRCSTAVGADDRPNIKCSERRLQECLSAGRSIADCIRENPGYGGGDTPGPEDDDFLRGRYGQVRGRVGMVIDTTPMGGVFIALCAQGLEQFCRGGGRF